MRIVIEIDFDEVADPATHPREIKVTLPQGPTAPDAAGVLASAPGVIVRAASDTGRAPSASAMAVSGAAPATVPATLATHLARGVIDAGPAPVVGLPPDRAAQPASPAGPSAPAPQLATVDAGRAPEPSLVRAAAGPDAGPVRFIAAPAVDAVADDLTQIFGIGPKISGILAEAGITTFAQLATTSISNLHRILANAGVRARVDSWPEEARLAAGG